MGAGWEQVGVGVGGLPDAGVGQLEGVGGVVVVQPDVEGEQLGVAEELAGEERVGQVEMLTEEGELAEMWLVSLLKAVAVAVPSELVVECSQGDVPILDGLDQNGESQHLKNMSDFYFP